MPAATEARIKKALADLEMRAVTPELLQKLSGEGAASLKVLRDRAKRLEAQAAQLRRLAKAVDDQQDLTRTGDILGTLRYMPPEAFEGKTDPRSDVYSLGLTLYELLTLRPAFDEPDRLKLSEQIKNEDWSLVSWDRMISSWPTRLWNFDKHYQFIGTHGGSGIGYGAPAAIGAALAGSASRRRLHSGPAGRPPPGWIAARNAASG